MDFDAQMRAYDKELERMKRDLDRYSEICDQEFDEITYEDMLFRMKHDTISNPVAEFQKYIPKELEAKIIDNDLLDIRNKYPNDESINDMLKILQMIRITDFRAKRVLEVG